uniref:Uncharacterized protein n=1 Tax=Nothoprocta perdicaria TaxID=30464 RepID=A0A8C7EFV8_NOTPE
MSQPDEERSLGPEDPELAAADPEEQYKSFCAVVIDMGTGHTRSGLAGDEKPRSVVPSRSGGPPTLPVGTGSPGGCVTPWMQPLLPG